jgi:hypothetical protein
MAKKLTTKAIENLKPKAKRYEVADGGCTGHYIVVFPSGIKTSVTRYRINRKTAKHTNGQFPAVPLAEGRRQTTAVLKLVAEGIDPAAEKRRKQSEAADRRADTVKACYERFAEHAGKRKRASSWAATAGIFRREILPQWGNRSVHDIRRRDVIDLVDGVCATRPVAANRVLAAINTFFDWLMNRDVIVASPTAGVAAPTKEKPRERKLSDQEKIRFLSACDKQSFGEMTQMTQAWNVASIPAPYGDIYRLLLMLGSRRSEIVELPWAELDMQAGLWHLPADRDKNHEGRVTPTSASGGCHHRPAAVY